MKNLSYLFLLFAFALLCSCGDEPSSDQSNNDLFQTPYIGWYESVEKVKSKAKGKLDHEKETDDYGNSWIQYDIGNGIKCRYEFYYGKLDFICIDLPYTFRAAHVIKEYLDSKYQYRREWEAGMEKGDDYITKDGKTYIIFFQQGSELSVWYFDINNPRYFSEQD